MQHFITWLCVCIISCMPMTAFSQTNSPSQPRIERIEPAKSVPLPENAVFAIKLSRPLQGKPQAQCDVWGVRSAVPTELITEPRRSAVLKAYGLAEFSGDASWLVLRCQMTLPDAARVTLRWINAQRGERYDPDQDYWQGQYFDYRVNSDMPMSVECERSNPDAGCNPLSGVNIVFTQDLNSQEAKAIVLKDAKGKIYRNHLSNSNSGPEVVNWVKFPTLPVNETLTIVWPNTLNNPKGQAVLTATARAKNISIRIGNYPPLVKFGANFGIAEKAIGGVVPLTVRSIEASPESGKVKLRQLKLNDEASIIEVMRTLKTVNQADSSNNRGNSDGDEYEAEQASTAKNAKQLRYPFRFPTNNQSSNDTRAISWLKNIKAATVQDLPKQLEGEAFEVLGIPLPQSGLYILEAESNFLGRELLNRNRPMYVRSGALVTDLAVHLHISERVAAVWVTQLSTGKPVPNAAVSLYDCQGKKLAQGQSNDAGWLYMDGKYSNSRWECPLFAFAKTAEDLSFVQSDWQNGIQTWRFSNLNNIYDANDNHIVHTVLARNLLKGGEVLHAKHFWRALNTRGEMVTPRKADLPNEAILRHQGSGERTKVPVSWDARGNGTLSYTIPKGAKLGAYSIVLSNNNCDECHAQFRVEEFRLPVLKAEVVAPKNTVYFGEPAQTQLRLSYLSGGVAAGESVKVAQRLLRHKVQFQDYAEFNFGSSVNSYSDDEEVNEQDLNSNIDSNSNLANGQNGEDKQYTLNASGTLTVSNTIKKSNGVAKALLTEMEYRDPNGETYRAQGRTVLWPSSVVVGNKTDGWASGKTRKIEFITLTPEGKPVANAPINVTGAFQGYVTHRVKSTGGFYSYRYDTVTQKMRSLCSGKTNAQGAYSCEFIPDMNELDSGQFVVQGTATDAKGRTSMTKANVWLYSGDEIWFSQNDHDRMDVLTDTPKVKLGDVATIQVRSPFREASAWVNIIRGSAIVDSFVVPLSGKNPSFKLPIKPNYEPNVYVNVLAVRGRVAEPNATALVDLARPAFKLGVLPLDVASQTHELKVKVSTNKTVYQSRETAIATISVTPPAGRALPADKELTVFAIDEALLELMPNTTWNALNTMFKQQGYYFESASANMQVLGKRHFGRKALPAGGGGGKSAARELFDTLLVWQGSVKLDTNGQATVNIPINDSLTRFKVVAVANAGTNLFGTGQASFTATKDLQLLSGLPISAREGDYFSAGFTVRNTTKQPMQVSLQAKANEQALNPQSINLAPGQASIVSWLLQVPINTPHIQWRIDATSNTGAKDALFIKQPVTTPLSALRYAVGKSELTAQNNYAVSIKPPSSGVSGKGEIQVSLSPALAADAQGVRSYMQDYPFFCLEQRTSKAITLRDKALWNVIYNTLDQYVTDSGLVNYYPEQFGNDVGYDVLTSYVLSAAHEAKFSLPEKERGRMLSGLEQFVTGKIERKYDYYSNDAYGLTERKLLALEALSRYVDVPVTMTDSLRVQAADLKQLSNRGIIQWLDILNRVSWPGNDVRKSAALLELKSRLKSTPQGGLQLSSSNKDNRWYYMYSEETSQVRLALLALNMPELKDSATQIAKAALQFQHEGGYWWQTQANVWGSLMLDRRAALVQGDITGTTQITVGANSYSHDWSKNPSGGQYTIQSNALGTLNALHTGAGKPVITINGTSWSKLSANSNNRATLNKTIKPLKQAKPNVYSVGDVLEVQLKFKVPDSTGWLALTDPIPTGATILGGGLKGLGTVATEDKQGRRNADNSYEAYPAYIENTATVARVYYEYLWGKDLSEYTYTYQIRINNAGTFELPPTQLEAMYDPSVYAYRPNPAMVVK